MDNIISLSDLVADENGFVHLIGNPYREPQATPAEEEKKVSPQVEHQDLVNQISRLTLEVDKGRACIAFATKHNLHFLGFCSQSKRPTFKEISE